VSERSSDLAVSIEDPYRPGDAVQQGNTIHQVLVIGRHCHWHFCCSSEDRQGDTRRCFRSSSATMVLISLLPPPVAPVLPAVAAQDAAQIYLLPVTVTNQGGSDAPSFALSVYLDGEQVVKKVYPEGLQVGGLRDQSCRSTPRQVPIP